MWNLWSRGPCLHLCGEQFLIPWHWRSCVWKKRLTPPWCNSTVCLALQTSVPESRQVPSRPSDGDSGWVTAASQYKSPPPSVSPTQKSLTLSLRRRPSFPEPRFNQPTKTWENRKSRHTACSIFSVEVTLVWIHIKASLVNLEGMFWFMLADNFVKTFSPLCV